MTKYIMIDNNCGFVWGDAEAETPQEACAALDAKVGPPAFPREYEEKNRPDFSNETGYHVYDGTGFDLDAIDGGDGQGKALIAAVEALPKVGYFKVIEQTDA